MRAGTKARDVSKVTPSSRDPIAQWLDVFTSLLALPAAEAHRIRDELEDHLRMRVDDLLILGMTEPEAVQKAVTELGETAQLARNFKAVRTHSRRRIAMYTALFAVAGLALTVSVAGVLPRSGSTFHPGGAVPSVIADQPEHHSGLLDRDLDAGTLEGILQTLADAGNARLFVHWGSLDPMGIGPESEVPAIPAKGLSHDKVGQLINSALGLEGVEELTARVDGNLLEIGSLEYFDRIETITIDHDVSKLVPSTHVLQTTGEGIHLIESIQSIIEPGIWENNGGPASITVNGSTVGVRAPERIQAQVIEYIARLEDAQRRYEEEHRRQEEAEIGRAHEQHQKNISSFEATLRESQSALERLNSMSDDITELYWRKEYEIKDLEKIYSAAEGDDRKEAREQLILAQARLESLVAERSQVKAQIGAAQKRIEDVQIQLGYLKGMTEIGSSISRRGGR